MTNTNTAVMELSSTPPAIVWGVQVAEHPGATLVVPDVHEAIGRLEVLLAHASARYEVVRTVFLGDWFDSWTTTAEGALNTVLWLLARFQSHPQDEFLLGNHDIPYIYPASLDWSGCSGYKPWKDLIISAHVRELQAKFKLSTDAFGWLCSHAGFCKTNYKPDACWEAMVQLKAGGEPTLLAAGRSRGGPAEHGGVTWQDWDEFEPIPGVRQVVGHTKSRDVRWKGENVCLDTNLRHYAVITPDSNLTVLEVPDATNLL